MKMIAWNGKKSDKEKRVFSYQSKLALIFTVMMVSVLVLLAMVMFRNQEKNIKQTLYRTVQVENQKNAQALENVFETIRDLSAALVLNESIYDSIRELPYIVDKTDFQSLESQQKIFRTMLISKLATMKQLEDMRLYSYNGMNVHVTRQKSDVEEGSYWEQEWFEPFVVNDSDCMLYFSKRGEEPVLTLCRTVREISRSDLVGYLEVNFRFSEEDREILEETSLEDGYCYYLLQGGQLAVSNDADISDWDSDWTGELDEIAYGHVAGLEVNGEEYLMTASPVGATDFVLLSGMDAEIFRTQKRKTFQVFLMVLLLGTGTAVGISAYAARGMTENIHKLNRAMKEAEKNPNIQVDIMSKDEIGVLGESFNRMILRLQETYAGLYAAELELKDAQYKALQAQINPHFLYNTLETIDALSICERTEEIGRIVQALSRVFRYAMGEKRSVPLREELNHAAGYLEILELRYEDRFTWEIDAEEELMEVEVPKIILQPLVENAIIHSILKLERTGHIVLRSRKDDSWLRIEVTDNGLGMKEETRIELQNRLSQNDDRNTEKENAREEDSKCDKGHIGVQNVNRRLRYFFGERYHMEISSRLREQTSFVICIRIE